MKTPKDDRTNFNLENTDANYSNKVYEKFNQRRGGAESILLHIKIACQPNSLK